MATLFDKSIEEAQNLILNASNKDLFSNDFENNVFNRVNVETPLLEKEKTTTEIGSDIITSQNAPENITYTPGRPMEYALFVVPIKGDLELFSNVVGYLFDNRKKFIFSNNACYKEFGRHPITGNKELENEIKNNAKGFIEVVEGKLKEFNITAEKFNVESLKPSIIKIIESERKKRNDLRESETRLNPFI